MSTSNKNISGSDLEIEMATEFQGSFDKFLLEFTEKWETSVTIHAIVMTQIIVLQQMSLDAAGIGAETWMKGGLDILSEIEETFAKEIEAIRQRNNLVDNRTRN